MKDPNERYWLFVVFTAQKTRQHLSATAFPPFSNIDFLHLLLNVCLTPAKQVRRSKLLFLFFLLRNCSQRCQTKSKDSQHSSWCPAVSPHLVSLLLCAGVRLRWVRGLSHGLIEIHTWPGGLGCVGWTALLLPPLSQQHKEASFRQVNIASLPPCSTQTGLNYNVDFTWLLLNALFPVCNTSEWLLLGKSCFNVLFCCYFQSPLCHWMLCPYRWGTLRNNMWPLGGIKL